MNTKTGKYIIMVGVALFIVYIFAAARPVPKEFVLESRWISSLASAYTVDKEKLEEVGSLLPFQLGSRFGYMDKDGNFTINQVADGYVAISDQKWAEFSRIPESIEVKDPIGQGIMTVNEETVGGGYPFFLDGRLFFLSGEENSISAVDENGKMLWTFDFSAPITCADAAAGLFIAGTLGGGVEVLDEQGGRVFSFEPGGSRRSVIYGCAFSKDANQFAIISGLDEQRFLFMERMNGGEYRVTYHEFIGEGFRRPVHVAFADNGTRVVFERTQGLGVYDIAMRRTQTVPLKGETIAMDGAGKDGIVFLITEDGGWKRFAAVKFPDNLVIEAPFKSDLTFIGRQDNILYLGGGNGIASFELVRR